MALLTRLFGSGESLAKELVISEEHALKAWQEYLNTVSEKQGLLLKIPGLTQGEFRRLQELLDTELVEVDLFTAAEEDIVDDLRKFDHDAHIQHVRRLEHTLGYAETRYAYAYALLRQLHTILKKQIAIVRSVREGARYAPRLILHLHDQTTTEASIVQQVQKRETFPKLFADLVRGEHIIQELGSKEQYILQRLEIIMDAVAVGRKGKGPMRDWVHTLFNAIDDRVMQAVEHGELEHHPDVQFEFVNSAAFIDFAYGIGTQVMRQPISQEMLNAFVHAFRERFNAS